MVATSYLGSGRLTCGGTHGLCFSTDCDGCNDAVEQIEKNSGLSQMGMPYD